MKTNSMILITPLCLLNLFFLTVRNYSQTSENMFEKGLKAFLQKDYRNALRDFKTLIREYPDAPRAEFSRLLLVKSCYQLKRYREIAAVTAGYETASAPGNCRDELLLIRAKSALAEDQMAEGARMLIHLRRTAKDQSIRREADSVLEVLADRILTLQEMRTLLATLKEPADIQSAALMTAQRMAVNQRYRQAAALCREMLQERLDHKTEKSFNSLLHRIQPLSEGPVRIGLIASLTGEDSETGTAIRIGAEYGAYQYNLKYEPKIELVILDDHSDIIQSVRHARALCLSDDISVIIGPADGQRMAAVAAEANHYRIPVIAPVTTLAGLTDIGNFIYQANIPLDIQSKMLAEYAFRQLNLKTFAVLAPSDPNGEQSSAAFIARIRQLGGRVLTVERYYEGTEDFRAQLIRIRKIGLLDLVTRSVNFDPLHPMSRKTLDSLYYLYYPSDTDDKDAFAVPMDHIQGLFMPMYSEELKYIAPQLAYYNIRSQWLGSMQWNSLSDLKAQQNYLNGAVFVADAYFNAEDPRYRDFAAQFRQWTGREPALPILWGYDPMGMITELVRTGSFGADEIQAELQNGYEWKGLRHTIRFSKDKRYNDAPVILQFYGGQIKKLN